MKTLLTRFHRERRSAIAMIFALTLLPLVLLIALAIDFSFFTEARSQVQLAADAAATHAIRAAAGTYALETSENVSVSQAQTDAINAGEVAGVNWFQAQLGLLPSATVPALLAGSPTQGVIVCPNSTAGNACSATGVQGAGFDAKVTYTGTYPPIFAHLFPQSANWNIAGTSTADAAYSYVEILMMLDTSQSMLIGNSQSDITTLEENSVCMPTALVSTVDGDPAMYTRDGPTNIIENYQPYPGDGDTVPLATPGAIPYYTPGGGDGSKGTCAKTVTIGGKTYSTQQSAFYNAQLNPGYPGTPCAFACHNTTNQAVYPNGKTYYTDLYGWARYLNDTTAGGVQLRLDQVLESTEQVIQSMIDNEQTSDQFSVGVYQFNRTQGPLIASSNGNQGSVGMTGDGSGDPSNEATYNLPYVLNLLNGIDYKQNPGETAFPPLVTANDDDGDTNFYSSIQNFANGLSNAAPNGTTPGLTATYPVKDVFIVTDGQEDECGGCGTHTGIGNGARVMGEMTSVQGELGIAYTNQATCQLLKNKGFTVYVLYIQYNPVAIESYLDYYTGSPPDELSAEDYPGIAPNGIEREMTVAMSDYGFTPPNGAPAAFTSADSTNQSALRACASNPTTDFFTATDNSTSVAQAMQNMLASALSGAITVTN